MNEDYQKNESPYDALISSWEYHSKEAEELMFQIITMKNKTGD